MSDNNTEADEADEEQSNNEATEIDFSALSDEQRNALSSHPEVRKMLTYEETSIPQVASMLGNLQADDADEETAEAYSLLVSGIAERRGRITESTVRKVLSGLVEEYDEVS